MKEKKTFQITDAKHLVQIGRVIGLLQAIEAIKTARADLKVPGMGVAEHAVIAEEAEARVQMMQDNLRTAFREFGSLEGYEIHCSGSGLLTAEPSSDQL